MTPRTIRALSSLAFFAVSLALSRLVPIAWIGLVCAIVAAVAHACPAFGTEAEVLRKARALAAQAVDHERK